MNIFELHKNLTVEKKRLDDETIKESVNTVFLNRLMSYDRGACVYAAELNKNILNIPKKALYLFYLYALEKRHKQTFLNMKKDVDAEETALIEFAQELYFKETTKNKIKDFLLFIKADVKDKMKELTKGGLQK